VGVVPCVLLLLACAGRRAPLADLERPPAADDWSPRDAEMEWFYVAAHDDVHRRAFHWAVFRAWPPPWVRVAGVPARDLLSGPAVVVHLAVCDADRDGDLFREGRLVPGQGARFVGRPLLIEAGDASLRERPDGSLRLEAGDVRVDLVPERPRIVHPPGHVGTAATGRLAYQSVTRLVASGTVAGAPFEGLAWMDHQWGDGVPGDTLVWDWCGLHAASGEDLMLFRVLAPDGRHVQTTGTLTDADGRVRALANARMEPTACWTSPTGRVHRVGWRVEADDLSIVVEAWRPDRELLSRAASIAYWEGPVRFGGRLGPRRLEGTGMAESVHGLLDPRRPAGGRIRVVPGDVPRGDGPRDGPGRQPCARDSLRR